MFSYAHKPLDSFDKPRRDFGHNGIAVALNRVSFHLEGYPIARQYIPEIKTQGTPSMSKCVTIDGEWRSLAAKKAFDLLMSFPSLAFGVGQPE